MTEDKVRPGPALPVPWLRMADPASSGPQAEGQSAATSWMPLDALVPAAALDTLAQAAHHLRAPCYLYDLQDGRFVWVNSQFEGVFGRCTRSAGGLFHLEDLAVGGGAACLASREAAVATARDGEVVTTECELRTAERGARRYRLQETLLARGPDGTPRLVLGLAEEADDGRGRQASHATRRLERMMQMAVAHAGLLAAEQEQRRLFETALTHIPLATAILDGATLAIRWANRAFADFVDESFRDQPLIGVDLEQAMGHITASSLAEIMRKVASTGRACSDLRYVYRGPQCGARYWRFSLQPLPGETGELMLHVEDVTGNMTGQRPSTGHSAGMPVRMMAAARFRSA